MVLSGATQAAAAKIPWCANGYHVCRVAGLSGYIFSVLYGISPGHESFCAIRRRKLSLGDRAKAATLIQL